ncbi:MAG: manganese transport protein [Algoriphagus sp.]|jgi:manganese transport protein
MNKLLQLLKKFGPTIMVVGFTIGTGNVTFMMVAGSKYGADLL